MYLYISPSLSLYIYIALSPARVVTPIALVAIPSIVMDFLYSKEIISTVRDFLL